MKDLIDQLDNIGLLLQELFGVIGGYETVSKFEGLFLSL